MKQDIPGTIMFDGAQAQKGYALNRMCFSFNSAENREEFLRDEDAYTHKFGLTEEQPSAFRQSARQLASSNRILSTRAYCIQATPWDAALSLAPEPSYRIGDQVIHILLHG
jgi:hypothetical protein